MIQLNCNPFLIDIALELGEYSAYHHEKNCKRSFICLTFICFTAKSKRSCKIPVNKKTMSLSIRKSLSKSLSTTGVPLFSTPKLPKKSVEKRGNCPGKWYVYEKLPKIAKFDRLFDTFHKLIAKHLSEHLQNRKFSPCKTHLWTILMHRHQSAT